jgi:alpha-galactosidase
MCAFQRCAVAVSTLLLLLAATTTAQQQQPPQQRCPPSVRAPRGWNSWDAFANPVNESVVLAAAEWIRDNLLQHGFDTITIDGGWYSNEAAGGGNFIDAYGLPVPDVARFPSSAGGAGLLPLARRVNAMGLKLGAWTIRGVTPEAYWADLPIRNSTFTARDAGLLGVASNCTWDRGTLGTNAPSAASDAWYASLADHYVANGLSFVKIDCMFNQTWWFEDEVAAFATAFAARAPEVAISWSPGGKGFSTAAAQVLASHAPAWGSMYRVCGDFHDNGGASALFEHFSQAAYMAPWIGVGNSYPDLDMLPFGRQAGPTPSGRVNLFTPDEQRLVMTLWAITRAPLILGAVLPPDANDTLTLSLVSNAAVLDVNENSCGNAPTPPLPRHGGDNLTALYAWTADAPTADGATFVALFNMQENNATVTAATGGGGQCVTNLWTGAAEGPLDGSGVISRELPTHAAGLWRVAPC